MMKWLKQMLLLNLLLLPLVCRIVVRYHREEFPEVRICWRRFSFFCPGLPTLQCSFMVPYENVSAASGPLDLNCAFDESIGIYKIIPFESQLPDV